MNVSFLIFKIRKHSFFVKGQRVMKQFQKLTWVLIFTLSTPFAVQAEDFDYSQAINLAGKQRMLTQKMSKEFLMIAKDIDAEDNRKNLIETMETFDTTLSGLINGSDELGLSPAPTKEIKTQLEKVRSMWIIFKLKLQAPPNDSSIAQVSKTNLPLLKEMN